MPDVNQKAVPPSCIETETMRILKRMKDSGRPISFNVGGTLSYMIEDDAEFEKLYNFIMWLENTRELRERLETFEAGEPGLSLEEFKEAFRNR